MLFEIVGDIILQYRLVFASDQAPFLILCHRLLCSRFIRRLYITSYLFDKYHSI